MSIGGSVAVERFFFAEFHEFHKKKALYGDSFERNSPPRVPRERLERWFGSGEIKFWGTNKGPCSTHPVLGA